MWRARIAELLAMWPNHCVLCLTAITGQQQVCAACLHDLPWVTHACPVCALPLAKEFSLCRRCELGHFKFFNRTVAAWRYDFPVDALIARFKYQQQWAYGRLLAELLAQHLSYLAAEEGLQLAEFLVAVPLAAKRQRQRGFNQAQIIAQWLAHQLDCRVLGRVVVRTKHLGVQQGLNAQQRAANVRGVFRVRQQAKITGRHLAIVDDVFTTGATSSELARVLLAAGARQVDIYCLARTAGGRIQQKTEAAKPDAL